MKKFRYHIMAMATSIICFFLLILSGSVMYGTVLLLVTVKNYSQQLSLNVSESLVGFESFAGMFPVLTAVMGFTVASLIAFKATLLIIESLESIRMVDNEGKPLFNIIFLKSTGTNKD